jgi:uncharacterized membrane protein (DUF485 family)
MDLAGCISCNCHCSHGLNSLAVITFIVLIAGFIVTKVYQHRAGYSADEKLNQAKAAAGNGQTL